MDQKNDPMPEPPVTQEGDMSKTVVINTYESALDAIKNVLPKADGEPKTVLSALSSFFTTRLSKTPSGPSMDKDNDREDHIAKTLRSRSAFRAPAPAEAPKEAEAEYNKPLLRKV